MAYCRRATLLLLLLLVAFSFASLPVTQGTAAAAAADAAADEDADMASMGGVSGDDEDIDIDEDVAEDEDDVDLDDDDEAAPEADPQPDMPAVLDPEGEENATGYSPPSAVGALFFDDFQTGLAKWTHTSAPGYFGEFKTGQGAEPTFKGDRALIIPEKARKYGLSAQVSGLEDLTSKDLVLQYELKLDQGMTCGGAYLKLPTGNFDPVKFDGDTPYSVMFGPDKCGATDKVHFIFQSKSPITGKLTEHHLKEPPSVANTYDKKTHLYTLVVKADASFQLLIDNELKKDGSLSDSFEPPVQPPKEVDDAEDKKPEDWVDAAKIVDPDATKPDDWDEDAPREIPDEDAVKPEGWLDDEPDQVPDPDAKKPAEWDDDEDGEWELPLISNPKCKAVGCGEWTRPLKPNPDYKGKWTAPMIDNPKYLGVWKPRKIANKEYYDASKPSLLPVKGLGFEIWTMDQGVLFDNVWLGTDPEAAKTFARNSFVEKQKTELAREEERNKMAEKDSEETDLPRAANEKWAKFMDYLEEMVDRLDGMLQPAEKWLVDQGAEPYLDKMMDMGIQKPIVVIAAVPLAITLLFLIILGGGKKKAPTPEEVAAEVVAEKKKTDGPTPDDAVSDVASSTTTDVEPERPTVRKRRVATAE